jgi:hypothetical protein
MRAAFTGDADDESAARPGGLCARRCVGRRLRERAQVVHRRGGIARECRDALLDAVFENAEVGRAKTADVVALLIGYDYRHQHLLHVEPDGGVVLSGQDPGGEHEEEDGAHHLGTIHLGTTGRRAWVFHVIRRFEGTL